MGDVGGDALLREKLRCPRCGRVAFVKQEHGGVGVRCPSCGGVHLRANDVEQVLCHELGLATSELRAKAVEPSDETLGVCSSCDGPLAVVDVEQVKVDLCLRCGAGWLDPGELERLTHGRHLERAPPAEIARAHLPKELTRRRPGRFVSVGAPLDIKGLKQSVGVVGAIGVGFALVTAGWVAALVAAPIAGAVGAGLWAIGALPSRPRILVDRQAGTIRALGAITEIAAVKAVAVVTADGLWTVVPRGEWLEGRRFFFTLDRVLAHRVAFQLSQVLEVPVETPAEDA